MSSRKSNLWNYHLASAQSMAATFTSIPFSVTLLDNLYLQMNCVGTPTGTFAVEVSGDYRKVDGVVQNTGNWVALSLPQVPTCAGADIVLGVNIQLSGFPWVRLTYTRTGGTGTCDIWANGKMI